MKKMFFGIALAISSGLVSIPSVSFAGDPDIKRLQNYLNHFGFSAGTADGVWGNNTNNAIIEYQTFIGTRADGSFSYQDLLKLEECKAMSDEQGDNSYRRARATLAYCINGNGSTEVSGVSNTTQNTNDDIFTQVQSIC